MILSTPPIISTYNGAESRGDSGIKVAGLSREHDRLSANLDQLKRRRESGDLLEDEIERAGPMAVWEVLGQDLEKLVEKLTSH